MADAQAQLAQAKQDLATAQASTTDLSNQNKQLQQQLSDLQNKYNTDTKDLQAQIQQKIIEGQTAVNNKQKEVDQKQA